jgi:nickel-dependent lactate racemase
VLHYFGGFGGGRKAIMPGLASIETIAHNHAMNLDPEIDRLDPAVQIGVMAGNPVAEDMLEAARMVTTRCLINTVLDRSLGIAGLFVGALEAAHDAACTFARDLYTLPIDQRADLVIAASPHTGNFVQTHKALYNAYQAVKPDGRIILLAPCHEGLGGGQFEKWLALGTPSAIIAELRVRAEINGQTALSTRQKSGIALFVTEMSSDDVDRLGARKAASLQEAVDTAVAELRAGGIDTPTVYTLPAAAYTVPISPVEAPA